MAENPTGPGGKRIEQVSEKRLALIQRNIDKNSAMETQAMELPRQPATVVLLKNGKPEVHSNMDVILRFISRKEKKAFFMVCPMGDYTGKGALIVEGKDLHLEGGLKPMAVQPMIANKAAEIRNVVAPPAKVNAPEAKTQPKATPPVQASKAGAPVAGAKPGVPNAPGQKKNEPKLSRKEIERLQDKKNFDNLLTLVDPKDKGQTKLRKNLESRGSVFLLNMIEIGLDPLEAFNKSKKGIGKMKRALDIPHEVIVNSKADIGRVLSPLTIVLDVLTSVLQERALKIRKDGVGAINAASAKYNALEVTPSKKFDAPKEKKVA